MAQRAQRAQRSSGQIIHPIAIRKRRPVTDDGRWDGGAPFHKPGSVRAGCQKDAIGWSVTCGPGTGSLLAERQRSPLRADSSVGAGVANALRQPRLERAIGVIYKPETERWSHYFHARLSDQFDAVIHYDRTRALHPLERTPAWESGEPPETFPSGI